MNLSLAPLTMKFEAPVFRAGKRPLRREFWTTQGWYIRLRDDDIRHSHGMSHRLPDIRRVNGEVVAGPFITRERLAEWFDAFIDRNPDRRELDDPTHPPKFTF